MKLNQEQINTFFTDGYLIFREFLAKDEIQKLAGIALNDDVIRNNALDLNDQSGRKPN